MKTTLYFATLSFCPDLTDPNAESLPVGMVGSGTIDQGPSFYFSVTASDSLGNYKECLGDQISESIMMNFHQFIQDQISNAEGITANKMMYWLQGRLRNSLHMSSVGEKIVDLSHGYNSAFSEACHIYQEHSERPADSDLSIYPDVRMTSFSPKSSRFVRAA